MSETRDSDSPRTRTRKPSRTAKSAQNGRKPEARTASAELLSRLRHMEILISVSHKVAGLETLDEVLATVVELAREHVAADRATLFLHDKGSSELYSRVAQGIHQREIRILDTAGIAGHVFQSGEGAIIEDAYADKRFNRGIDEETGYRTETLLCAPVRTVKGDVIGVIQALNRRDGKFTVDDLDLLEAMTTQAAVALETTQFVERMEQSRQKELEFLDIVADITSELDLGALLRRVMAEATRMLSADRSTLFLNDEKTGQLFSRVAMGDGVGEIRLPNTAGIAGAVFTSGKTVNIPYAYADLRFNPSFDKQTGYFTRSILCVPVVNKDGKVIGVTQALNKRGGTFTAEDESRLKAFTAQVAISLENAKLFDDVRNMKNYNEGMLQSMSNAVITTNDEGLIVTCNRAGQSILKLDLADIIGKTAEDFFTGRNAWIVERIRKVEETQAPDVMVDAEYVAGNDVLSVNINLLPLFDSTSKKLGTMVMIEDISSEKRMKSTMSRYMDPGLVSQLLDGGEDFMEGKSAEATVLFSDIRGFTTITESLGAQGTVAMLNEYFTIMVDCITREGGMLDKFIGDAIMAAFGIPIARGDDEDHAMRAAIAMIREMREWNAKRTARGDLPIDMGIGLNTDSVVSGNIGSPKRMDYTIIGDGVNLAARLESACKQYGARILLSGNTVARLKGTYRLRLVDRVVVKGKTKPVEVFECLDYHSDDTFPNLMDNVGYFNEAMRAYTSGDWDKAIDLFGRAGAATPGDVLPGIYVDRCSLLLTKPPAGTWDGVWRMTSK